MLKLATVQRPSHNHSLLPVPLGSKAMIIDSSGSMRSASTIANNNIHEAKFAGQHRV